MCGITGYLNTHEKGSRLRAMSSAIAHRGPDADGLWQTTFQQWHLGLAHRRLRIMDLSARGDQPMHRGSLTVVFNGEIYNFASVRRELETNGYRFSSDCDTEVILHAYHYWGADCLLHLEGMFAFALWNADTGELFLGRDRLGKKPLYFCHFDNSFAFASEIKSILKLLDRTPPVDHQALDDYLTYLYIPYPRTIFEGILQLEPGTFLRVQIGEGNLQLSSFSYWNPRAASASGASASVEENQARLDELLNECVQSRMMADVPLGVLLSGGLDSSSITAVMARSSAQPIRSFAIGFEDNDAYDEIPFSRSVADHFNCEHHVLQAKPSAVDSLAKIVWHFDQPFGNPTAVLAYILSDLTKHYVTVALGGDGGDELFAGYPRYFGAQLSTLPRSLPSFVRNRLLPAFGGLVSDDKQGYHHNRRFREFLAGCGKPLIDMYSEWVGYFTPDEKAELYTDLLKRKAAGHDSEAFLRAHYQASEGLETLNRLAYVDMKSFLCCNVLEYSDRMSMAHALELRAPLCDRRLFEFALHLPANQKLRFGNSKWLLKRAMRDVLPQAVLKRSKLGFNPPVSSWLRGELRTLKGELLSRKAVEKRGLFRPDAVARMIDRHQRGERDFSLKIWALMVLEIWFRLYQDADSVERVQEQINGVVSQPCEELVALTA